ncbi:MAG: phosphatase PAP2 family protein [Deltaproteobacteria bacterium]
MKRGPFIALAFLSLAVLILFPFDVQIGMSVRDVVPDTWDDSLNFASNWGLYVFYASFAALMIYSLARKKKRLTSICIAYLKAQIIFAFLTVRVLKILLGRARPLYGTEFTFFSFDSGYNAFPSGHAADAFVSGVFLYCLLRNSWYRFLPIAYALFMAWLRMAVSVHHPSDVVAGMAIGIIGARYMLRREDRWCR